MHFKRNDHGCGWFPGDHKEPVGDEQPPQEGDKSGHRQQPVHHKGCGCAPDEAKTDDGIYQP